jgi:hypothetical protein
MTILTSTLKSTLIADPSLSAHVRDRSTRERFWRTQVWVPIVIGISAAGLWMTAWAAISTAQVSAAQARAQDITWLGVVGFGLGFSALLAVIIAFTQANARRPTVPVETVPYFDDEPAAARSAV